ncbi:Putative hemin import ATP-binding protein HrtA [Thiorhodovibrio winogradskyi]|uniref:Hemin import ATP-binding protein HrtA n=1 Tax=Thiorhodovibrio winogradskyi TaxID=77007 RepID=A0ABZ0SE50_9GAMM|nr:ATP-binding cassette domain-containing protein [Thiorhodovibrio winogradskyi]
MSKTPSNSLWVKAFGVDYAYGAGRTEKQVLFHCHLSLIRGQFVILTGPSGSGKTTLLTLIGALRSLQSGSIELGGRQLLGMQPREMNFVRRDIGFIFQDHNLFRALTAEQTLRLAMRLFPHRYSRQDLREAPSRILDALGMAEHMKARPDEISTGQKQRVAIARALINRPNTILADEPTASLDRDTAQIVIDLLRERAKKENALVLIVSHDQRLFTTADRVIRMVDGSILAQDSDT